MIQGCSKKWKNTAATILKRRQAACVPGRCRYRHKVVFSRPAAFAILEEAGARPGTVIALETHGRGGLSRLLLGSVADKILRGASVPVLVHRTTG
jgi:nucleotide-binding universal stress UspA family protein